MQTELIKITGMTCGGCTSAVTKALKEVGGVGHVEVSLASGEAAVHYDEHATSPVQLKSAVTAAGYGIASNDAASAALGKPGCCAPRGAS